MSNLTNHTLSQFIREQVSPHISNDYETFMQFMEAYYEWLQQESQPGGILLNHKRNIDIDESLEQFAKDFISRFSQNFPTETNLDIRKVAKQLRNIYTSKGSEQSFKLLFRILFSDEIDIKYPGQDVLIASGGNYTKEVSIKVTVDVNQTGTPFDAEQNTVIFYDTSTTPQIAVAEAVIDRVLFFFEGSVPVYELFLTPASIKGNITAGLKMVERGLDETDQTTCIAYVIPTTAEITSIVSYTGQINEGQIYEIKGEDLEIGLETSAGSNTALIQNTFALFDFSSNSYQVSSDTTSASDPFYVGMELSGANIQTGTYITQVNKDISGNVISVELSNAPTSSGFFIYKSESKGSYAIVRAIDNETGAPTRIDIIRYGINYYRDYTETLVLVEDATQGGTKTITVNIKSGAFANYEGTFKGNGGKLSDIVRLQDKQRYQKFAYVIQTGVSVNNWRAVVKEILNPAGFRFFGELALKNQVNLSATINAVNVEEIIRLIREVVATFDENRKHTHKIRASTQVAIDQTKTLDRINKPRASFISSYFSNDVLAVIKDRTSLLSDQFDSGIKHVEKISLSQSMQIDDKSFDYQKIRNSSYSADSLRVKYVIKDNQQSSITSILSQIGDLRIRKMTFSLLNDYTSLNDSYIAKDITASEIPIFYFAENEQYITPSNEDYVGPIEPSSAYPSDTVSITVTEG